MSGISLVICTYNGEKYIFEQIQSILNQTVIPDEIILCDDNSNDSTFEIAKSMLEKSGICYKAIKNEQNLGYNKNFEKALAISSKEYISLSDQDDVWLPNKLELLLNEMKGQEQIYGKETPILAFSDVIIVDETLDIIYQSYMKMQKLYPIRMRKKPYALCVNNVVIGMTSMMNRSLLNLALPFPEDILNHDWWFAVLCSAKGKLTYIDKTLCYYRQHGNNSIGAYLYHDIGWVSFLRERLRNHKDVAQYFKELYFELYDRYRPHMLKRIAHIRGLYNITGDKKLITLSKFLQKGGITSAIGCILMGALPPTWQRKLFFLASILKRN